jgi:hypothetical protein
LSFYFRYAADTLPFEVGAAETGQMRRSDGNQGYLSFGPYAALEPGSYVAGFHLRDVGSSNDNAVVVDVIAGNGAGMLAVKRHPVKKLFNDLSSFVFLSFEAETQLEDVEVRLFVEDGVIVESEGLTIFRCDERRWSCA